MPELSAKEAEKYGITAKHDRMPNGELRFRLRNRDGSAYIRTEATSSSGWQKSHYHKSVRETYIVQSGTMALAEWIKENLRIRLFGPSEIVTTEPYVPHNVYLFANAVIHTVKHGDEGEVADWHADSSLDEKTTQLLESDILSLSTG